jgi:hypothetical protein
MKPLPNQTLSEKEVGADQLELNQQRTQNYSRYADYQMDQYSQNSQFSSTLQMKKPPLGPL